MERQPEMCGCRRVTRFLRNLRGGAQSSLVLADDNVQYALKFNSNPQGQNLLFNEALGTELYRVFGLPTADYVTVDVDDKSLDNNPNIWFEHESGRRRPSAGLQFGSKIIGQESLCAYEIIPRHWYSKIQNREEFWGAMVVDVWAEHADNRQAIFTRTGCSGNLKATFFDHGHMFRGASGIKKPRTGMAAYLDKDMYWWKGATDAANKWVKEVQHVSEGQIKKALAAVPLEWQTKSTEGVCRRLLTRRKKIEALITEEIGQLDRRRVARGCASFDVNAAASANCGL